MQDLAKDINYVMKIDPKESKANHKSLLDQIELFIKKKEKEENKNNESRLLQRSECDNA